MDSPNREHFLANLKSGGKYEGIVGLYRHNVSADYIGVFDQEIINALAPSVKWIAHNGCKGLAPLQCLAFPFIVFLRTVQITYYTRGGLPVKVSHHIYGR